MLKKNWKKGDYMKMEINTEVESITKISQEKKEKDTETYKMMLKEANVEEDPRTILVTSPDGFEFGVGEGIKVVLETQQKKLSEYKEK